MRGWVRRLGLVAALGGWGGCARQDLAERSFAVDYQCSEATTTTPLGRGRFQVTGCGKTVEYNCWDECAVAGAGDGSEERADASSSSASASAVRPPAEDMSPDDGQLSLSSDIRIVNKRGQSVLMLDLRLDRSSFLRLSAIPDKRADLVQLKLVRRESAHDAARCNFDWMINDQRVTVPKPVSATDGYLLSQRIHLGPDLINELAGAEHIGFRSCQERYALMGFQVMLVREFVERLRQEIAWKGKARDGGTGGMLAPSDGWPAWAALAAPPMSNAGAALDPRELFKKLSSSVFRLEATREHGLAQGSAVAVTNSELLTNCHVVQGARKLTLKQDKAEWVARIVRADPTTDRCVITAPEAKLTPIGGVRTFDSLEVGEPVYTLGSPVGLELTLSDGILSGRREESGRRYVQTTAPISPGSSGGGLFDARGNLIGVTTLAIVGKERLNQALNFAIPADAFWQK